MIFSCHPPPPFGGIHLLFVCGLGSPSSPIRDNSASGSSGPFHTKVLVGKESFPFLPIPCVGPKNLVYKICQMKQPGAVPLKFHLAKLVGDEEIVKSGKSQILWHDLPNGDVQGGHRHFELMRRFEFYW